MELNITAKQRLWTSVGTMRLRDPTLPLPSPSPLRSLVLVLLLQLLAPSSCAEHLLAITQDLAPPQPVPITAAAAATVRGPPCTLPQVTLNVWRESDIQRRRLYPPSRRVALLLRANLRLTRSVVFDASFSCTVFTSAKGSSFTLFAPDAMTPALRIQSTHNVLVWRVNFHLPINGANNAECDYDYNPLRLFLFHWHCPAVWMYDVYGVQLTRGSVRGRVDIVAGKRSRIDGMRVVVHPENEPGAICTSWMGNLSTLVRADVAVSNNVVLTEGAPGKGAEVGISVTRGSVGVDVLRNRVVDFTFAGVLMGQGDSNTADASLSLVARNELRFGFGQLGDNTAVYFDTHWVNPGNVLRCNYARGGGHCLYLDYVSSGVRVDGLVCDKTADGLKLNAGKNNVVTGLVVINSTEPSNAYISCQNYNVNNCANRKLKRIDIWLNDLATKYQTRIIRKHFPFLTNFCARTSIRGINCNQGTLPAYGPKVTGACSGLPTENDIEVVSVFDTWFRMAYYINCDPFPAVRRLNRIVQHNTTHANAGFISAARGNYGLKLSSPIRKRFRRFRSCDSKTVGPIFLRFSNYENSKYFNIFRPRDIPSLVP